ncbi:LPXTG cell wall anchor domain-containing protein [Enterococcus raffinosus]|uniref:LPXTG cell wall anchor domain-containing protein n=1 Tax=Enterococcus raffinosus TaxID=71452 RepID=UPI001C11D34C|nr:LPXTG cell wall anchor domain-containing protein [Enterococcus raffinosus]MBU5359613.1 LPXTG cell wall anchor domain-containing protein [Enterococcus raffinosus]
MDQAIPINKITNKLTKSGEYTIRYIASQNFDETKEKIIKLTVRDHPVAFLSPNTSAKKSLDNTGKVSVGASEKKGTLPKTGSEQSSVLLSIIGFLLLSMVDIVKKRKAFRL